MKAVRFLFISILFFYSGFAQASKLQFKILSNPETDNLIGMHTGIVELDNLAGAIYSGTTHACDFPIEDGTFPCGGGSEVQVITHSDGRVDATLVNDEKVLQFSAKIQNDHEKDICWFDIAKTGAKVEFIDGKMRLNGVSISTRYGKHVSGLCSLEGKDIANHRVVPQAHECGFITDGTDEDKVNTKVYFVKRNTGDKSDKGYDLFLVGELFYQDTGEKICDITDNSSANTDKDPKTTWIDAK